MHSKRFVPCSMKVVLCGHLLVIFGAAAIASPYYEGTVFYDDETETATIRTGILDGGSAVVTYTPDLFKDGWDKVEVWARTGNGRGSGYSAGFAEGFATQKSMWSMHVNNYADWFLNQKEDMTFTPEMAYDWLLSNWNYTKTSAENGRTADSEEERTFWETVQRAVDQVEGLLDGYNEAAPSSKQYLTLGDVLLLNADGDVESLQVAMGPSSLRSHGPREQRCSAMFKLTDDNADILFGHATWDHFDMMLRQLKTYRWSATYDVRARMETTTDNDVEVVSFSSSPGFLTSVDDFYLTSNGLAVIETTNGNMNATLWDLLTERSLLSWIRSYAANAVATDALSWTKYFGTNNSGTYNNQWMVLDMNMFVPGRPLEPNTFVIAEQIPGLLAVEDRSAWLNEKRYWASYNIPAIPSIWRKSGFGQRSPAWRFSHSECPRAHYMQHLNASVVDLPSFQRMIRYNTFGNDSNVRDAWAGYGISARFDLLSQDDANFGLGGGIDGKATSVTLAKNRLIFHAQNGPSHDNQTPFDWRTVTYPNSQYAKPPSHIGMPDLWNYDWKRYDGLGASYHRG